MTRLAKTVALLMLVFWGLATAHCGFERLPGFEFLACCDHLDKSPHQDNDCNQDGCAVVESGFYRPNPHVASLSIPAFVFDRSLALWESPLDTALPVAETLSSEPLALASVWLFTLRMALPPRAPSLLS